ncbi:hypothetical protein LTR17_027282 [Elasticomyces elasticus]|nr:hypothetical protein LTR17_027282 [Elasticomyces elasticus]
MGGFTALVWALPAPVAGQKPQYPPTFPATPILPPSINCQACSAYGNDIKDHTLSLQHQRKERLAMKRYPKHFAPSNESLYILSPALTPQPGVEHGFSRAASGLQFTWTNSPSFQFRVSRASSGDIIFDTYGHKLVFEDQFLELTLWNAYNLDNDQELVVNSHSLHPVYLETRHGNGSSQSHGVYARNAHGQEWLIRDSSITYRTIGGSFELYFLSGSKLAGVISQHQMGLVNTTYLPAYWHLGFQQVRWGYQNWTNLQDVVDAYAAQNIQLEGLMSDLDYLKVDRDFTDNPGHYDVEPGKEFLGRLHANGQHYMPILDPNICVPDPTNASDAYPTYGRGAELDAYIRDSNASYYIGVLWPGFSAQHFWTEQIVAYHPKLAFDGFWLDVNDTTSFCTGSCGQGRIEENPIHYPLALPGDANTSVAVDLKYPEMFNVTNATEAASASSAIMSQSIMCPTPSINTYRRTYPGYSWLTQLDVSAICHQQLFAWPQSAEAGD